MPTNNLMCVLRKKIIESIGHDEELTNKLVQSRVVILKQLANVLSSSPAINICGAQRLTGAKISPDSLDNKATI